MGTRFGSQHQHETYPLPRTASLPEAGLVLLAAVTSLPVWLTILTAGVWWMQKTKHPEIVSLALPLPIFLPWTHLANFSTSFLVRTECNSLTLP